MKRRRGRRRKKRRSLWLSHQTCQLPWRWMRPMQQQPACQQ
jgi:hypothetical protein